MVHDDAGSLWLCLVIAFGDSFAVSFLLRGETRREKICGVDLVQIVLFPTQSAIESRKRLLYWVLQQVLPVRIVF